MTDVNRLPPPPPLDRLRAESAIAIYCDFDGTLVELADTPDGITVPDTLRERIRTLEKRLHGRFALVSGRAIDDLESHLGPIEVAVAGSHGGARRHAGGDPLGDQPDPLPEEVICALSDYCDRNALRYEAKTHGGAIHYRQSPDAAAAALAFARQLAGGHELDVKTGKSVIELIRPGANKGGAVRAFQECAPFKGGRPIFIGDDETDENGFAVCRELGGFGIAVGPRETEHAEFHLDTPAAVHHWLSL